MSLLIKMFAIFMALLYSVASYAFLGIGDDTQKPSKANFERALTPVLAEIPICKMLGGTIKGFPFATLGLSDQDINDLGKLASVGFLHETTLLALGIPVKGYDLTEEGKKRHYVITETGSSRRYQAFCIGQQKLIEILGWSEPTNLKGKKVVEIEYMIQAENLEGWLIKGFGYQVKPYKYKAVLELWNDGWRVVRRHEYVKQ